MLSYNTTKKQLASRVAFLHDVNRATRITFRPTLFAWHARVQTLKKNVIPFILFSFVEQKCALRRECFIA